MKDIYISQSGLRKGPFTEAHVEELIRTGKVTLDTVFQVGDGPWQKVRDNLVLSAIFWKPSVINAPPTPPAEAEEFVEEPPDYTKHALLGVFGAAIMFMGCFCPAVTLPLLGGVSLFGCDDTAAYTVVAAASATALLLGCRQERWMAGPPVLLGIFTLVRLFNYDTTKGAIVRTLANHAARSGYEGMLPGRTTAELVKSISPTIANTLQLSWGGVVIAIGTLLVLWGGLIAADLGQEDFAEQFPRR